MQASNTLNPADWAERICDAWRAQVDSIFHTGDLLQSAKAELKHGDWLRMLKAGRLPFGRSTVTKLMKLAACEQLRNADHGPHLPACWRTLFELALLTPEQFADGIESGAINPGMQRKDVKELRGDPPKKATTGPSLRAQLAEAMAEIQRLRTLLAERKPASDGVLPAASLASGAAGIGRPFLFAPVPAVRPDDRLEIPLFLKQTSGPQEKAANSYPREEKETSKCKQQQKVESHD
jgi:hypothetical protein